MILYNVTVSIDKEIEQEWLAWMLQKHIPEVMATACFVENKVLHLLQESENEGSTYAFQYFCNSLEDLAHYQKNFAPALQKEHTEKFKDKFVAFRTILEVIA